MLLTATGTGNIDKLDLTTGSSTQVEAGDVKSDENVDIVDALMTARYFAGLPGSFPLTLGCGLLA